MYIGFEDFQERSRDFCFSSFLTKPEIIKIIVQVKPRHVGLSPVPTVITRVLRSFIYEDESHQDHDTPPAHIGLTFRFSANRHAKVHEILC